MQGRLCQKKFDQRERKKYHTTQQFYLNLRTYNTIGSGKKIAVLFLQHNPYIFN